MADRLGTDTLDQEGDDQGDEEDEAGDLNRMMERRHRDAQEALLMMVVMMSCMRMLVAVMLLRDVTMYVVVCIGLVRMVRSLHIVRVGRFSVMSIRSMERVLFLGIIVTGTVLMYAEVVNMLLRGLRMAAMPHEDVEQETTDEAQHRLRRQNPQHRRRVYAFRSCVILENAIKNDTKESKH